MPPELWVAGPMEDSIPERRRPGRCVADSAAIFAPRRAARQREPSPRFSPSEAVFGAQPVLPGQYLTSPEPLSPSFLRDLQETLNNRTPPPVNHNNRPGPLTLPDELLLTRFVLVRRDGAQPLLSPMYDGPYLVLERSLRFFKIQVGTRQDTVSTLRLKPCRSPPDAQPAAPPHRGRPLTVPAAATVPADVLGRLPPAAAG